MIGRVAGAAGAMLLAGMAPGTSAGTFTYIGLPFGLTASGSATAATGQVVITATGSKPLRGGCSTVSIVTATDGQFTLNAFDTIFGEAGKYFSLVVNGTSAQVCLSSAGVYSFTANLIASATTSNGFSAGWQITTGNGVGDTTSLQERIKKGVLVSEYSGQSSGPGKLGYKS